jgi:hypothetical protein
LIKLGLAKLSIEELWDFAYEVADAIEAGAAEFTAPNPSVATLRKGADELKKGQEDFEAHDITKDERDALRVKLEALIRQEANYVEALAALLPPEDAAALIAAGGFEKRNPSIRRFESFTVTQGETSGSVVVRALLKNEVEKKSQRVMFHWEVSVDGQSWAEAGRSFDASMTLTGLEVGRRTSFRYRVFKNGALGDPSKVLTLVVV